MPPVMKISDRSVVVIHHFPNLHLPLSHRTQLQLLEAPNFLFKGSDYDSVCACWTEKGDIVPLAEATSWRVMCARVVGYFLAF